MIVFEPDGGDFIHLFISIHVSDEQVRWLANGLRRSQSTHRMVLGQI